jgi:hypothetical protein
VRYQAALCPEKKAIIHAYEKNSWREIKKRLPKEPFFLSLH